MKMNQPIFIIGNPRSGTSLFRLMLTNHPQVCIPPESGFIQWWYGKYKGWSSADADSGSKIQGFIEDLATSKKIETWNLDYETLEERIAVGKPETYWKLCALVYLQFAADQNKPALERWGDKNNYYIDHLDLLLELYPQAQFLFVVRDGRDVACSYRGVHALSTNSVYKPKLPTDIEEIAKEWVLNSSKILNFSKQLNDFQKYFLRYEDLILHSEKELKGVCEFLKIRYSENMLEYHITNEKYKTEPDQLMDWKMKTLEKPDAKNLRKYKKVLTKEEINTFEKVASKMLKHYHYG